MAMDRVLGKFRNIRRKKKDQEMIDQNSSHQGFKIVHGDIDDDLRKKLHLRFHEEKHHVTSNVSSPLSFHDVVDTSEHSREAYLSDTFIGNLVESMWFRLSIISVIVLNSIIIGVQTDTYLEKTYGWLFMALDKFFLTVYVMEILIKWYHDFLSFWKLGWNVFDFVIVTVSLLGPIGLTWQEVIIGWLLYASAGLAFLSGGRVLRILRVLRALRSLRSISSLKGLQIVVHTVIHSIPDMANIVVLLTIVMFIFAVLGVSFFGERCPTYFETLGSAMFTLFICTTQDGWMGIMEDLKACDNHILGAIYLLVFITIGAFIFANLVVAVVVTNLEWAILEQKEMEEQLKHKHAKRHEREHSHSTIDVTRLLQDIAIHQEPLEAPELNLNTKLLENYFLLISAIEDNLFEFIHIKEELNAIVQEVKALAALDDTSTIASIRRIGSSSSQLHMHPLPPYHIHTQGVKPAERRTSSVLQGDAMSRLINMRQSIDSGKRATNMHSLLTQLHTKHTTHFSASTSGSTHRQSIG